MKACQEKNKDVLKCEDMRRPDQGRIKDLGDVGVPWIISCGHDWGVGWGKVKRRVL